MNRRDVALPLIAALALAACTSTPPRRAEEPPRASPPAAKPPSTAQAPVPPPPVGMPATPRRGAYYQDDGPGDNPPPNLELTPDAVPADEPPLKTAANRPYVVFGRTYTPQLNGDGFRQRGMGSWYGRKFHGQKTSSGEPYDMYAMTAAHPTLPLPSWVRVTNVVNGKSVVVKVNDRGPFHSDRIIDLSYTAAYKLGYAAQGSTMLEVTRLRPGDVPPVMVAAAGAPVPQAAPVAASRPAPSSAPQPASRGATTDMARPAAESDPVARVGAVSAAPQPEAAAAENVTGAAAGSTQIAGASSPAAKPSAGTSAPAAQPSTVALATSTQPDGVYLQLGAFGAREGAEEFRIKTYQQLPWLTEAMYIVARDRLHRVQLGPFRDRAAAQSVADRIREALQFKPVFVLK